jgi:hypothetical protein
MGIVWRNITRQSTSIHIVFHCRRVSRKEGGGGEIYLILSSFLTPYTQLLY